MVVLMALWCTVACTTTDEVPSPDVVQKYVSARLSLSVDANNGGTTRMSAANTQNSGNFLGVRDLWLVPFETAGEITATDTPLDLVTTTVENVTSANGNVKYFFTPNMMRMKIGMASFLAYGRADHDGSSLFQEGVLEDDFGIGQGFGDDSSADTFRFDQLVPLVEVSLYNQCNTLLIKQQYRLLK